MKMSITKMRGNMADALNRVAYGGERLVLQRRGKGVAALVSMEDFDLLETLEDMADYQAALKARKEKGMIPLAKVKERYGIK